jgi:GNAT superfamily N-acetyltransferase
MLIIDFLKNHPKHVETVSRWIYDEWDHKSDMDLDAVILKMRSCLNDDRIPLTLVAIEDGKPLGTVSIYEDDLNSRPDLRPWLASLFVHPDHRNKGVGSALMEQLIAIAKGLEIVRLYLHTETASEYYRRKGWRFLFNTINDRGEETEVFAMDL